ncbi:MAG TPA: low temperature requirement protein A [Microthrixaceae bacterium]|nr:low temperature requirement protein A [Microthrixaceae bacterium]
MTDHDDRPTGTDATGTDANHAPGSRRPASPAPPPRLIPAQPEQSWLELFYDLAFVAAIVVMSTTYSTYAGLDGLVWLALVFSMIWCTWLATTMLLGSGLVSTLWTRTLLVCQMVLVLGVAITSDYSSQDYSTAVAPLFSVVLVTLALFFRAARRANDELHVAYRGYALRCLLAAAVFLIAPTFGWPLWYPLVWLFGIALVLAPTGRERRRLRMDSHHMVHRFGEFTIIMLGEVFVKLGITASHEPLGEIDVFALPLATAVVFGIWWLYFTDIPEMGLSDHHGRRLGWIYLHFPLHLGIIAVAVALAHTLLPDHVANDASAQATSHASSIDSIQYIVIPIAVILLAIGLIGVYGGAPRTLARRRLHAFLAAVAVLIVSEAALLGTDSYDLEASAVIVTVVLALTAWRIRRIGTITAVPDTVPDGGSEARA